MGNHDIDGRSITAKFDRPQGGQQQQQQQGGQQQGGGGGQGDGGALNRDDVAGGQRLQLVIEVARYVAKQRQQRCESGLFQRFQPKVYKDPCCTNS